MATTSIQYKFRVHSTSSNLPPNQEITELKLINKISTIRYVCLDDTWFNVLFMHKENHSLFGKCSHENNSRRYLRAANESPVVLVHYKGQKLLRTVHVLCMCR
jgi:hypothetical protein